MSKGGYEIQISGGCWKGWEVQFGISGCSRDEAESSGPSWEFWVSDLCACRCAPGSLSKRGPTMDEGHPLWAFAVNIITPQTNLNCSFFSFFSGSHTQIHSRCSIQHSGRVMILCGSSGFAPGGVYSFEI